MNRYFVEFTFGNFMWNRANTCFKSTEEDGRKYVVFLREDPEYGYIHVCDIPFSHVSKVTVKHYVIDDEVLSL